MAEPDTNGGLDVTGTWHGQYSYPRIKAPVHFLARLTETASWFSGAIEEVGTVGKARGVTISATVQGRRIDRSVTFLKLYDGAFREYDNVHYAGAINGEGSEIEGTWTIPGNWSGRFLMIRDRGLAAKVSRSVFETVR